MDAIDAVSYGYVRRHGQGRVVDRAREEGLPRRRSRAHAQPGRGGVVTLFLATAVLSLLRIEIPVGVGYRATEQPGRRGDDLCVRTIEPSGEALRRSIPSSTSSTTQRTRASGRTVSGYNGVESCSALLFRATGAVPAVRRRVPTLRGQGPRHWYVFADLEAREELARGPTTCNRWACTGQGRRELHPGPVAQRVPRAPTDR
jgi:hypothetical protein